MKDTVNILFVCGYGAGSSLIMKMTAESAMKKFKINSDTKVTSVGEVNSYFDWADIIAVSEKLAEGIVLPSNKEIKMIKIANLVDGEKMGNDIYNTVKESFPTALKG